MDNSNDYERSLRVFSHGFGLLGTLDDLEKHNADFDGEAYLRRLTEALKELRSLRTGA